MISDSKITEIKKEKEKVVIREVSEFVQMFTSKFSNTYIYVYCIKVWLCLKECMNV